jgi:hypothetical protein
MIATDPLSLFFIGCFLVGLLFLLITAFTGHGIGHHTGTTAHVGHTPVAHVSPTAHVTHAYHGTTQTGQNTPHTTNQDARGNSFSILSIVNPMTIVFFLTGFGLLGYILHVYASSFALPAIFIFACIGGLAVATILLVILNRILANAEGMTIQDVSDRTGLLGKVNMTIPPKGLGEIMYTSPGGMRKSVPARSIDGRRLEREQEIVVVNYQGGVAEVDTWEHFINQEESDSASTNHADEMATLKALLDDAN